MDKTLFTTEEQEAFSKRFMEESRYKAWSSMCHADWTAQKMILVEKQMEVMDKEHGELIDEIEKLSRALDSHTVENRQKRKDLQGKADVLASKLGKTATDSSKIIQQMQELAQTAKGNFELADHAKDWRWSDADREKLTNAFKPEIESEKIEGEFIREEETKA